MKVLYKKYKNKTYEILIDNEDEIKLNGLSLYLIKHRKNRVRPILKKNNKYFNYLGRYLLNASKKAIVDHINGNPLDNRKCNLRIVSNSINIQNTGPSIDNPLNLKGVSLHKSTGKYRARIYVNYKEIHLGLFDSPEKAAKAYNLAAIKFFGKMSWQNKL